MEAVSSRTVWWRLGGRVRVDFHAVAIWALAGGLVLYLAFDNGGYDLVVHSQVGVVIWWVILIGALFGVLPGRRLTRTGWTALALLAGFVVWTALACTWSISWERSLDDLSLVTFYLGVLVLATMGYRSRREAMRHTVGAVAAAVAIVAGIALLSRLHPGLFTGARVTASFLPGTSGRLAWPLGYWNALAALIAIGLPLQLSIASSAGNLAVRATAAGAIPLTVLSAYLTFSRGGAIEIAVALVVFILLAPDRIPKLAMLLVGAGGSAALIAGAVHRPAVEQGLVNGAARHQGLTLLAAVALVSGGVALISAGIGLAARHGNRGHRLQISRWLAAWLLAGALMVGVVLALSLNVPESLSHAWTEFKQPHVAGSQTSIGRFGSISGNGRYAYWKVAVQATSGRVLTGSGPGTFQLLWLPQAPFLSYVVNAHSLYVETYAELGLVGLLLLIGFFVTLIVAVLRRVLRVDPDARTRAAGIAAALIAFLVAAAIDWVWQMPVLPVAVLLLAACVLAPVRPGVAMAHGRFGRVAIRGGLAVVSAASLIVIGVPLATTNAVRRSQTAVRAADSAAALIDARSAMALEPRAASPALQAALVLELRGELTPAVAAARQATDNEPMNWQPWLVLSRLEAELGRAREAVIDFRRARTLNPRSSLFDQ